MAQVDVSGAEGNSRLTSVTGMVLLVLLAVEGATILRIRQLITVHVYLGVLLLGPVLLKTAATVYRFARYYTGSAPYVTKGPPHPVLRILGPLVILTTLALFGTGVGLIFSKPGHGGFLLFAHKASFFLWFAVMAVHVIGHLREAALTSAGELRSGPVVGRRGRALRLGIVGLALVVGVAAASALLPKASPWTSRDHGGKPSSSQQRFG
jgi:hypothetical protein